MPSWSSSIVHKSLHPRGGSCYCRYVPQQCTGAVLNKCTYASADTWLLSTTFFCKIVLLDFCTLVSEYGAAGLLLSRQCLSHICGGIKQCTDQCMQHNIGQAALNQHSGLQKWWAGILVWVLNYGFIVCRLWSQKLEIGRTTRAQMVSHQVYCRETCKAFCCATWIRLSRAWQTFVGLAKHICEYDPICCRSLFHRDHGHVPRWVMEALERVGGPIHWS